MLQANPHSNGLIVANYLQDIIKAYAERQITKSQFKKRFTEWQKAYGLDHDYKGTADRVGIYLIYRNITATIKTAEARVSWL